MGDNLMDSVEDFFKSVETINEKRKLNSRLVSDAEEASKIQLLLFLKSQIEKNSIENDLKKSIIEEILFRLKENPQDISFNGLVHALEVLDKADSTRVNGILSILQKTITNIDARSINLTNSHTHSLNPADTELLANSGFTKEQIQNSAKVLQFLENTRRSEGTFSDEV